MKKRNVILLLLVVVAVLLYTVAVYALNLVPETANQVKASIAIVDDEEVLGATTQKNTSNTSSNQTVTSIRILSDESIAEPVPLQPAAPETSNSKQTVATIRIMEAE